MISDSIFFNFKDALKVGKNTFFLSYKGVLFPMYLDYKGEEKWVILPPAAHSRDTKKTIPSFQRSNFSDGIEANVISLFDPSLFLSEDLRLAWFVGTKEKHYAEILAELFKEVFLGLNVNTSDVLIYGTSGGGIPAIKMGTYLKNSTVYCGNIQTDASKYYQKHYNKMREDLFSSDDKDLIYKTYKERMNCYDWDGSFNLVVTQNIYDEFHYKNHFLPYYNHLKNNPTNLNYNFYTYENEKSGHGVLGKDLELKIINTLLYAIDLEDFKNLLPHGKIL